MDAISIRPGDKFLFPRDVNVYIFIGIEFDNGIPIIRASTPPTDQKPSTLVSLIGAIQAEINARIEQNTICHAFMQGFRYYNTEEKKFEGPYRMEGMNGLFDKYIEKYPVE